jgi:hypothetical protein
VNDSSDTPAESPTAKRMAMDTRLSGSDAPTPIPEPQPRARLESVPSEPPPLSRDASALELARHYAWISMGYKQMAESTQDFVKSLDGRLAKMQSAPPPRGSMPPGYRLIIAGVVASLLVQVGIIFELWHLEKLVADLRAHAGLIVFE